MMPHVMGHPETGHGEYAQFEAHLTCCTCGQLAAAKQWFITTLAVVLAEDGLVQAACESKAPAPADLPAHEARNISRITTETRKG